MLRFYSANLIAALSNLHIYKGQIPALALSGTAGGDTWQHLAKQLKDTLQSLAKECGRLPVSSSLLMQIQ